MTLAQNQDRLRKWGFLKDTSSGYGPNTEAGYTLALNKLEEFWPLASLVPAPQLAFPNPVQGQLSVRGAAELIEHEAIVLEWYKDSEGIGTWGIGVTDRSGHSVSRYKNSPATIDRVLEIFVWLLMTNYLPAVLKAFQGYPLKEHELAAALSFHYNTGAIGTTDWVKLVKAGKPAEAKEFLTTHYLNDGDLTKRRKLESELFFKGVWTTDGKATVLGVKKPSYTPDWASAKQVDIIPALTKIMGA